MQLHSFVQILFIGIISLQFCFNKKKGIKMTSTLFGRFHHSFNVSRVYTVALRSWPVRPLVHFHESPYGLERTAI